MMLAVACSTSPRDLCSGLGKQHPKDSSVLESTDKISKESRCGLYEELEAAMYFPMSREESNTSVSSRNENSAHDLDLVDVEMHTDLMQKEESSASSLPQLSFAKYENCQTSPDLDSVASGSSGRVAVHVVYSTSLRKSSLKSSLKVRSTEKSKGVTNRRVRGLWNEGTADCFAQLRDTTLQHILSFLSMDDICSLSAVSGRWRYLALDPARWESVDATDFVRRTYHCCHTNNPLTATQRTSEALINRLLKYSPGKLTILSIRDKLNAKEFLPSLTSMQELVLSEFATISDTHLHVMLLSSAVSTSHARAKCSNSLRKLVIEDCPLLTNASVRSIASQCQQLEYLSLRGCRSITDVLPLRDLLKLADVVNPRASETPSGGTSLSSFFTPPAQRIQAASLPLTLPSLFNNPSVPVRGPPGASGLEAMFSPLPTPSSLGTTQATKQKTSTLSALFHPPAEPVLPSSTFSLQGSSTLAGGHLCCLDFSNTGVTAAALADALRAAPGNVVLESLEMRGSGESWTDSVLRLLDSCRFKVLDIGCSDPTHGSGGVTDKGFRALALSQSEKLCLSGQKGIKTGFLTTALSAAQKLHSIDLEACSSLFAGDEMSVAKLAFALQKSRELQYINISRCFSDETKAESSPQVLKSDEERGRLFLEAICNSASRLTLQELDLSWCWFVTASEVAKVRRSCPKLQRVHVKGTRCNESV